MIVHCVIFHFSRWHLLELYVLCIVFFCHLQGDKNIFFVSVGKIVDSGSIRYSNAGNCCFFMQVCAHLAGSLAHLEAAWGLAA